MAGKVCPVWVGYLLASPLRKLSANPGKILGPYIEKGMRVLDIGCAMGFFSLPLAQMVGSKGEVICVDVQEKMIRSLEKRAQKAGLSRRIETRICHENSWGLDDLKEEIDFVLASAVIHEIPDASGFFLKMYEIMKPTGRLLVIEPKGHVSEGDFDVTVSLAKENGFKVIERPRIARSHVVVLGKDKDAHGKLQP